ncbi:MAG: hypothetical protein Kow0060_12070 [Methylohalobius crimeensis]
MRLVTFDPFRALDIPGAVYVKPEQMFLQRDRLAAADWALFPESWQVNALHYGLKLRIFPSVVSYHLGMNKVEMTRAFWSMCPDHVPHTRILPNNDNGREQVLDEFAFPFVIKEPRNSMGRGVHLIQNASQFRRLAASLEVLYAQEYLPLEADLRVVLVGDEVVTAYWRCGGDGFRHNIAQGGQADFQDIPSSALELVTRVASQLGVDHAGFDVAMVEEHPYLLEFNVLFGNEVLNARGIKLGKRILNYLHKPLPNPPPAWLPKAS